MEAQHIHLPKIGKFTFKYRESSEEEEELEVKEHVASVNWIDNVVPTAEIKYSTTRPTNDPVVVTLINESEEIIITNNGNSRDYIFTENREFTFEFIDKAGNIGTVTAKVDWISEEPVEYEIGDINNDGKINATDLLWLTRHLIADETKLNWILTDNAFSAGDINEDGKITSTDLLLMQRLVLEEMSKQ